MTVWDPKDVHDRAEQVSPSAVPLRETSGEEGLKWGRSGGDGLDPCQGVHGTHALPG